MPAAEAAQALPPGLPSGVSPYLQRYRNWSGEIAIDPIWHVSAGSEARVVELANWAHANGWTLRPLGFSHNWSPFAVSPGSEEAKVLMVDMKSLSSRSLSGSTFVCGAGASMDEVMSFLDLRGRGMAHIPAPGDITIGGVLAIGGHGTGVIPSGQRTPAGHSFGSLPNMVTALRAVVWDDASGSYVAKSFSRSDSDIGALLVSLGRIFITEVSMRVGPAQHMRCRSHFGVTIDNLLGAPGSSSQNAAAYMNRTGRFEITWFPYTTLPWFKTWETASSWLPPLGSRPAITPYNYLIINSIPKAISDAISDMVRDRRNSEAFGKLQAFLVTQNLTTELTWDLWGRMSHLFRYVKPSTLRMTSSGYTVLCSRADVQWVLHSFYQLHQEIFGRYHDEGKFPMNGPVEIRASMLDDPADVGVSGAADPLLSPTRRRPDHPEWDCAVWIGELSLPNTPDAQAYYKEFEDRMWQLFDTGRTGIRVEWSKGWGFDGSQAYADTSRIPATFDQGQPAGARYSDAVDVFKRLDPHGVFVTDLHRRLSMA